MANKKRYWLYKIINLDNWKLYFGITSQSNPRIRWYRHCLEATNVNHPNHNRNICKAIREYGKERFEFRILKELPSWKEACNEEIRHIALFDTMNKEWGYNMTKGGDGTPGYTRSKEDCEKIRQRLIGKYVGDKNPFYGKEHSDEFKSFIGKNVSMHHALGTYNNMYEGLRKIKGDQKQEVIDKYATGLYSYETLGKEYGVSRTAIVNAVKGVVKKKIKRKQSPEHIARRTTAQITPISEEQRTQVISLYFDRKLPIRVIENEVGLSKAIVAKILRTYKTDNGIVISKSGKRNRPSRKTKL
jgi:group I intron endonuclease